jgi:putative ABC transport system permease protein
MLQLSLRGIRAHLGRFVLTGLAIAMSVGFLTGASILFPTTSKMIDGMIGQSVGGVNVVVRRQQLDASTTTGSSDIQQDLVAKVQSLSGVTAVQPMRYEGAAITLADGKQVDSIEASTWVEAPFDVGKIVEGRSPKSWNELVIDRGSATENNLKVGDKVELSVSASAPQTVTLVGVVTFGQAESVGGLSTFMTAEAMERITKTPPEITWLLVAGSATEPMLQRTIRSSLPAGLEAITGTDYKAEQRKGFAGQVTIFKSIIGGFAAVSFLVGAFLIANTFSIIVAQRTREVALLRAIGALRKQVRRMVLLEAIVVGAVCSALGLGVGIAMAKALIALLKSATGMPDPGVLVMSPSTFAIGMLVGVSATVAAAWMPVRRGTKVEPVAALRTDDVQIIPRSSRLRTIIGILMIIAGAVLGFAPSGNQRFALGSIGAIVGLVGMALVAPLLVIAFFSLLKPLFGKGAIGELAIDGAQRSPRRTASTAAAVMIGLSLVTGALIMVNSMKRSIGSTFERQVAAASLLGSGQSLGDDVVATIQATPGVDQLQTVAFGRMAHDGVVKDVTALSTSPSLPSLLDLDVTQGVGPDQLKLGEVLVFKDVFEDGVTVGSTIDVAFRSTGKQKLMVVGVFANNTTTSNYIISTATAQANVRQLTYSRILVHGKDSVALLGELENKMKGRGLTFETIATATKRNNKELDGFLAFIMGLLAVSMVIALLGVVNTMALSVLERTRELGMLRAVGMTRRQVRQVIRREAVAVSAFGVILGLLVGLPIGVVLVRGLSNIGVNRAVIPVGQLALVAGVALAAGVIAAVLPARRAAKLDVLAAINHV